MGTLEPGKRLVRSDLVYRMDAEAETTQDRNAISMEKVIATAQKIMSPFTLECPEIAWWTV